MICVCHQLPQADALRARLIPPSLGPDPLVTVEQLVAQKPADVADAACPL
jgi:hypothetical protein